jgi:hypothetical protein
MTVFFAATDRGIVFGPALAGVVAALIILRRR